ncbi:hypothetical protein ACIQLG_14045 [Terribacillus saccharophilus]|uniref:hypothetical protein n=1 Tax=Terribacillus saccharophilus TaxID=361277 RepID=UPI00382EF74B
MTVLIIVIGQFLYIANAPLFPKNRKIIEYSYLAINLAYIACITLYYPNDLPVSEYTFLLITIIVYLPVFYQALTNKKVKKQA